MCNRYISMTGEEGIEKDPKEKTLTAGLRGAFQVLGTALAEARRKEAPCCVSGADAVRAGRRKVGSRALERALGPQVGLFAWSPLS